MKKIVFFMFIAFLIIPVSSLSANNDDIKFGFQIMPHQSNSRAPGRYRSTNNVNNQWKVNMKYSGESTASNNDGYVTRFWIEHENGTNVSKSVEQSERTGTMYVKPYSSANKSTVYLTAENNTYTNTSYYVSGIWDEETW